MKLMIDIKDALYSRLFDNVVDTYDRLRICDAVKNGTPLPTDAVDRVTIKEYLESYNVVKTELSGDAVDRRAVYEIINDAYFLKLDDGAALQESIHQLPSVTPQPKMGRWIEHFDESGKWYECDQCHTDWGGSVNYCPNCGAKMQEVEE